MRCFPSSRGDGQRRHTGSLFKWAGGLGLERKKTELKPFFTNRHGAFVQPRGTVDRYSHDVFSIGLCEYSSPPVGRLLVKDMFLSPRNRRLSLLS